MVVVEKTRDEKYWDDYDNREYIEISIDGKCVFDVSDGEPEDATLSRDFSDCNSIISLMKQAYEAGRAGEEFKVEYITGE